MILSLGDLSSRATTMAGGRLDWQPSEVSFWANQAYSEVGERTRHTPEEALAVSSTTSGGNRIALPSDFNYATAFTLFTTSTSTSTSPGSRNTQPVVLVQRDERWLDAQDNPGLGGVPEAYLHYSTWLELVPSPNSAYSIQLRYQAKNPTLISSTDTIRFDERWHAAVLYKTVELLEASRGNAEGELLARNRYLNYVTVTMKDQGYKQQDRTGMTLAYKRSW